MPESRGRVWIRPSTVDEFDVKWGVYLQDPDDLPNGWIDVLYEGYDNGGQEDCEDWARGMGYEIISDPSKEGDLRLRSGWHLAVVWITPEEAAMLTIFRNFPGDESPLHYMSQIQEFIRERSCSLPYLMIPFEDGEMPKLYSSEGHLLEPDIIDLV